MLIHERFVFLHFQKTGGTFITESLACALPKGSLRDGAPDKLHAGWADIPPEAMDLPVLAYVRNPWDWYVSWYHFMQSRRPDNVIFRLMFANGKNDFATTVQNACTGMPGCDDPELARLMAEDSRRVRPLALKRDFCTTRFLDFFGAGLGSDRLTIGRFETLVDDLERFLLRLEVELPDGAMARIHAAAPVKATRRRRPYREYYDDDLANLVAKSCKPVIDRFGYRF
ncbi:MAG TPA: hypothetical protein VHQ43_08260 [Solirubrobacterales bacterium]|jgi:hypothetical protein|nr:hypothetical protein [Solirubrobacterales bacterium]